MKYIKTSLICLFSCMSTVAFAQMSPRGMWDNYDHQVGPSYVVPWGYTIEPKQPKVDLIPEEPEIVEYLHDENPGTVVVDTKARFLYYIIDKSTALEYPIGVGRKGFEWNGVEKVSRIVEWPEWIPPPEMRQRRPDLPVRMKGGVNNPLGAVAIYLGDTLYRIHGTNDPKSIGKADSSGCIRMMNEHALHLASLVQKGTVVKVY